MRGERTPDGDPPGRDTTGAGAREAMTRMSDSKHGEAHRLTGTTRIPTDPSLEALPLPAATFDLGLRLLRANTRFASLCGPRGEPDRSLADLLVPAGAAPVVPQQGGESRYVGRSGEGEPVVISLSRSGEVIGATVTPVLGAADGQLSAALDALAEQGRAQNALLELSREVALAGNEDALVACIARSLREIFPGRFFCIRIVDPRTYALTSLYAEGRLLESGREVLAMRKSSAQHARLDLFQLPEDRVQVCDEPPLVFAGAIKGFATPLAAGGQFFGLVNLEYPQGLAAEADRDQKLLNQLANQAAVGVKNAKLIEELLYVKKHLEELIESANALIVAVDREGKVLLFNRALEQLSGHAAIDVLGRELRALIPESEQMHLQRVMARCSRGEKLSNVETRMLTRDGNEIRVSFNTATVFSPTGELEGVIAIGQDLTVQKELERRVLQAEKLASLGQLAAGVVHEINNPLTTITMYAEALIAKLERGGDESDLGKAKRIQEAANRILEFARELTTYARPARERPELVEVHALLEQAITYCEHVLKTSGVRVERRFADDVHTFMAVRTNLVQVFVNLLTNACHAMPEGREGLISVSTCRAGGGVEIRLTDNGVGIAEKDLARVFDPFFTTKAEGKGTGLGLSLVQGIIANHGGTISVESTEGQGTTFTVWIPDATD